MHYCILGCGDIAQVHARTLKKLENFVPSKPTRFSFASRSKDRAAAFKKKLGGELALGSYEEACSHKDIDAVVICTPNDSHRDLAIAALENGKDVVIEKPIACTVAEADEILAKAQKLGRHVLVAENHRYRPHVISIARYLSTGALGVLKMIRMNVMRTRHFKTDEWRSKADAMGGGPLIDGGIHWVNVLLTLANSPVRDVVAFEAPTTVRHAPGEDTLAILCQFANGCVGDLSYSWGIAGSVPLKFFSVHGSEGSIYCSNSGMIGLRSKKVMLPVFFPMRDWKGYQGMWQDFLICLANGNSKPCLASGEIGRRDLAFIESAYASLKPSTTRGSKRASV